MDEETPMPAIGDNTSVLHLPWRLVERLPWVEAGTIGSAIAGTTLLIAVALGGSFLVFYAAHLLRSRTDRRRDERERSLILESYDDLPEEVVRELSVRSGVLDARSSLLATFTTEWHALQRVLPNIIDAELAADARTRLEGAWSTHRRQQFYLRYHAPLSTVMNRRTWHTMFSGSYGVEVTGAVPVIRGVGESVDGMYVIVSTAAGWTVEEWDDMLPVLRVGLDAPNAAVDIVNSEEVVISLRDRDLRPRYVPVRDTESVENAGDDEAGRRR